MGCGSWSGASRGVRGISSPEIHVESVCSESSENALQTRPMHRHMSPRAIKTTSLARLDS